MLQQVQQPQKQLLFFSFSSFLLQAASITEINAHRLEAL